MPSSKWPTQNELKCISVDLFLFHIGLFWYILILLVSYLCFLIFVVLWVLSVCVYLCVYFLCFLFNFVSVCLFSNEKKKRCGPGDVGRIWEFLVWLSCCKELLLPSMTADCTFHPYPLKQSILYSDKPLCALLLN